jgi:hypothetical protein
MRFAPTVPARLSAGLALLVLGYCCPSATALTLPAAKGDESHVYFATDEPLLPADTDGSVDIYVRAGDQANLITIGDPSCAPACGNGNFDVETADGLDPVAGGIVFSTPEPLVPADTDTSVDIYERSGAGLELISQGPGGFNGAFDARLRSVGGDGSAVFETAEPLDPADTDASTDVYRRSAGSTELLSQGPNGFNGALDADWAASSADESTVFLLTSEQLLDIDTDGAVDLYERKGQTTKLISRGPIGFNGEFDVSGPVIASTDGTRSVFATSEQLREGDEDDQLDVYTSSSYITTLVSGGSYIHPKEDNPARVDALDPIANQIIFSSPEDLNEEDHDKTGEDIYESYFRKTILVSQGPAQPYFPPPTAAEFLAYATGGYGAIFFSTTERLLPDDTDSSADLYERELLAADAFHVYRPTKGTTYLVSRGTGDFNSSLTPTFKAVSPDRRRVYFTTEEQLAANDTDGSVDLYERLDDMSTKLVSAGQVNGNGPFEVSFRGDGSRPLFSTSEQLVGGDDDDEPDLYERVGGRTELISTAVGPPSAAVLTGISPASPSPVNNPSLTGSVEAGASVEIFANGGCAGEPVAEGSGSAFATAGVSVSVPDDSTTSFSARAVNESGISGPCSQPLTYVEDSTPPAPPLLFSTDPPGPANDNSPRVHGASEAGTRVRVFTGGGCQGGGADGDAAELSTTGVPVVVPDNATTPITSLATDAAGNSSACSGQLPYVEDSIAPQTRIVVRPKKRSTHRLSFFRFRANTAKARFLCRLDARRARRCRNPYTLRHLKFGRHRLAVAAVDQAGNVDPTPAVRSWQLVRLRNRSHHR